MKFVGLATVCLSALAAAATNVIQLADRNFTHDTQIGEGMTTGPWFIKFYAPWCGHCKRLAPIWEKLVDEVHEDQINVAEVDCVNNKKICARFDVPAYPTLLYFRDNKMYKYRGTRDVPSLAKFVREGYKEAEHMDVPVPLTFWGQLLVGLEALAADLEQIKDSKKAAGAALLIVGMSIGSALSALAVTWVASGAIARARRESASTTPAATKKKQ